MPNYINLTNDISGSFVVSGNIKLGTDNTVNQFIGTASCAVTASFAATVALGASASYALNAGSANSATSSSFATNALTANSATTATTATSASFATNALTANSATSASFATTASAAKSITFVPATASYATTSTSASHAVQADTAMLADFATNADQANNANAAESANTANDANTATSASYALSTSFAMTADRKRVTIITAALASSASATGSLGMDSECIILGVSASINCRLRLYNTTGSAVQDSLRGIGIDPSASAGVLLDVVFPNAVTGSNRSWMIINLAPPAVVYGGDAGNFTGIAAVTQSIPYYIQNYTAGTQSCSVDIVWIPV